MLRVLIVEDDRNLADVVSRILVGQDYSPDIAYNGTQGYEMAEKNEYDVILLDLMLPGLDGIDVCKRLKESGNETPIIMVTARASVSDRIVGFDSGADDYLPKPFSPKELVARIKAIVRRTSSSPSFQYGKVSFGDIAYEPETGELVGPDDKFELSDKERLLMNVLLATPGDVCLKNDLLDAGWHDNPDADGNNVEAYISFLRKRLAFVGSRIKIRSLRKIGYKLEKE